MYLSRIHVSAREPGNAAALENLVDPYRQHQWLWTFFDRERPERPYLYRTDGAPGGLSVLVLSDEPPRHESSAGVQVQVKEFTPRLESGDRLGFSLRLNPVVSRNDHGPGRGKRHDVVMRAKRALREEGAPVDMPWIVHQAVGTWLTSRADRLGCRFVEPSLRCEAYAQHELRPSDGRRSIRYSTVDVDGLLDVVDPDRFLDAVKQGIGPQKAMGCGLMLLRRV